MCAPSYEEDRPPDRDGVDGSADPARGTQQRGECGEGEEDDEALRVGRDVRGVVHHRGLGGGVDGG